MPSPALASAPLTGDLGSSLAAVPASPGVGQLVAGERGLVLAMASNLRRWAASQLGLGKKPPPGRRPKTNLAGIATAVGWIEADGAFRQRLCYERLMAPQVPLSSRRDLKPPVFLHLDAAERFPRVTVRSAEPAGPFLFGPFTDRRAAERAREALHRAFPLRPCDFVFEPDPALPLGAACLFAQVRSCSAPCLVRIGEGDYRNLAARAAAWLGDPRQRPEVAAVPATVAAASSSRAVVVDVGRRAIALFSVSAGRVQDDAIFLSSPEEIDAGIRRLQWPASGGSDDWPWLMVWLRSPKGRGSYLLVHEDEDEGALAARVHAAAARFGDKLTGTRGQA